MFLFRRSGTALRSWKKWNNKKNPTRCWRTVREHKGYWKLSHAQYPYLPYSERLSANASRFGPSSEYLAVGRSQWEDPDRSLVTPLFLDTAGFTTRPWYLCQLHQSFGIDIPCYHTLSASVCYHFIHAVHHPTERNIFTAGRKKLAELSVLLFTGIERAMAQAIALDEMISYFPRASPFQCQTHNKNAIKRYAAL